MGDAGTDLEVKQIAAPAQAPADLATQTDPHPDAAKKTRTGKPGHSGGGPVASGPKIQHYELIRPLGRGGMGAVLLARDIRLGRLVAIKLLTDHGGTSAQRFLVEARATAQLNHENIVVIHDLGEYQGTPYMVLEYLKGKTLRQWLDERKERFRSELSVAPGAEEEGIGIAPARAIELMLSVARALACAHEHGIVHRDLKPSNIVLTDGGTIKVLDFGIAKLLGGPSAPDDDKPEDGGTGAEASMDLTMSGAMVGTRPYMSPEQWGAGAIDHRSDIWAAGIILAELILGRHPLAPLSTTTFTGIRDLDVPMPSLRDTRPELGKLALIVDRCLLKRKEDRLGSARELVAELESLAPDARRIVRNEDAPPFTGLSAFQQTDADRFFGRSRAITEVVARLSEQPLLAIVGPSGAGKSSFVRAGLIPSLERTGDAWETFTLRPGTHPLSALAELLLSHTWGSSSQNITVQDVDAGLAGAHDRDELVRKLRAEPGLLGAQLRARARRKLERALLFIDQFEEVYTLAAEDERASFFACLAGVADDVGSPLRVVITIRSDFLDRVVESDAASTGLSRGLTLLPKMDRANLREVLVRPLQIVGYRFEHDGLVEEMVDTLEHTAGALPLLQFTATKLWELRDRERRVLTEASYREIGGVAGTLAGHADAVLGAMSSGERKLARSAFLRLVTPERTRALSTLAELRDLSRTPADMDRVLSRLIDARLLTVEGSDDAGVTVEIVHESLISAWPTLSKWISDNQEDAALLSRLRHAAKEWQASGEADGLLWRGRAAQDAKRWYDGYTGELAQAEERYLKAVFALDERTRRQKRSLIGGGFALLTIVAGSMSYLAWQESAAKRREHEQAGIAQAAATRAQIQAERARDAIRLSVAHQYAEDPTTVLALLRESEGQAPLPGWSDLAKYALDSGVARTVLLGHEGGVYSASFSPDGKRIVSGSYDKTVRVWNADGKGEPLVLTGHTDIVWPTAWSPDGKRIASGSHDKTVRVWNADGKGAPFVFEGHRAPVKWCAWSPNGKRIASSADDMTIQVWNADGTGEPLVLRGHEGSVASLAFSPDGRRIVSSSWDKTVRVWNADGKGEPLVLTGHAEPVVSVAWSPDGRRIASGSWDKTIRVWGTDGEAPLTLRGHGAIVWSVAWSPDGQHILSGSYDKTVRIWNADGTGTPRVVKGHSGAVFSAAYDPDGQRIASASWDRTVRVWNAIEAHAPRVLEGYGGLNSRVAFSPDGRRVASIAHDKSLRVWNADGSGTPIVLEGHERLVRWVAWSPDGKRLVSASEDTTVRVWSADGSSSPHVLRGHTAFVFTASFSPDGKRIVSASDDRTVRVWDAEGKEPPLVLAGHTDTVYFAAFSPDGQRVVSAADDKTARVWSADGKGAPTVLSGHAEQISMATWSPDGRRILTVSNDKTVRVWDAAGTGAPIVLSGHTGHVRFAAWSPDGRHIASASRDNTVRVWNADGNGEPVVLRGHAEEIKVVAWSPDGRSILSASADATVRLWDADGQGDPVVLRGHTGEVHSVAWSPDGKRVASTSTDNTVRVWQNLAPLARDDPRFWTATTYCMPAADRQRLLGLSEEDSRADLAQCQARVRDAAAR